MYFLENLWKAINPPKIGATEEQLYYWRLLIVFLAGTNLSLLVLHFAWVSGSVPFFETEALAKRSEVIAIEARLLQEDREDVIADLNNTRREHCKAKGRAKDIYQQQLTNLQERYKDLYNSAREFDLPPCDDYSQ